MYIGLNLTTWMGLKPVTIFLNRFIRFEDIGLHENIDSSCQNHCTEDGLRPGWPKLSGQKNNSGFDKMNLDMCTCKTIFAKQIGIGSSIIMIKGPLLWFDFIIIIVPTYYFAPL